MPRWRIQSPKYHTMRAHEFITEQSHEQDARDALITILVTQHALGIPRISFDQLSRSLAERNFFVDPEWLKTQIQDIPVVDQDQSSDTTIVLKSAEIAASKPEDEVEDVDVDASSQVERMAQRALAKRSK